MFDGLGRNEEIVSLEIPTFHLIHRRNVRGMRKVLQNDIVMSM